jgi:hypothetical protein
MTTATHMTRIAAGAAALVLLTGTALAGPASARNGADDRPTGVSDDRAPRTGADDRKGGSTSRDRTRSTKRGTCTATTDWKLTAKARDRRIEVEFEVDSDISGQRWTYRIRHDGTVKASGKRTTHAPSGSFSVEKRLRNAAGVHTIGATAKNARTGESCKASLKI